MIVGEKVLAIILARGGSKGIPRKNIREVGGQPLIGWTIKAAQESRCVDRVLVSSDDNEICAVADRYGAISLKRPAALATDEATSLDAVLHALDANPGFGIAALLQPTSPLRTAADIDAGLALLIQNGSHSCVSVAEATDSPHWMYRLADGGRLEPLLDGEPPASRRQDLPRFFVPNGALYAFRTDWLRRERRFIGKGTVGYMMPASRSLDIDTEDDLIQAKAILEGK